VLIEVDFPKGGCSVSFLRKLRSQTSRDKLAQLFDNQFRQMAMLIDQQIRLLQTRYPNEHLVSTSDFLDEVSLQALVLHGIIWRTRFLTLHPETA
jgi:hypothetical protein